ncbi:hypothetical protein HU200_061581 [Digitaria exilis]|uniref:Uncharacterized protein n=1 Tax=Digitaria exilis TaxID=1010633 RepID=A0A835E169_9POAL|nr:hypothetical protein HU200_061581 [Digitaria exilis]
MLFAGFAMRFPRPCSGVLGDHGTWLTPPAGTLHTLRAEAFSPASSDGDLGLDTSPDPDTRAADFYACRAVRAAFTPLLAAARHMSPAGSWLPVPSFRSPLQPRRVVARWTCMRRSQALPRAIEVELPAADTWTSPRSSRAGAGDPVAAAGADPDAVAQSYWHVHAQDKSAWTQEMDIRSPSFM